MRYNLVKWFEDVRCWALGVGRLAPRFVKASLLYYVISINLFILASDFEQSFGVCVFVSVSGTSLHFAAFLSNPICALTTSFGWLMAHEIDPDRKML